MAMQELLLKGFRKVDEDTHPELLQADTLAVLENMVLDYPGKNFIPKKRGGYGLFNSSNVGNNIFSIHDVIDSAGSNYILISQSTKLQKALTGDNYDFTDVKTGLTTGLKTRIAPIGGGKYVLTNGTDKPFVIGGIDFANIWNVEIAAPDMTGVTIALDSGGAFESGTRYSYKVAYRASTGDVSPVSGAIRITTDTAGRKINLANLPVSSDTRVVSKLIYRTEGNGNIFYLLASIDNVTTSFTDNYPDTSLTMSETIARVNAIAKASHVALHKDRLFFGKVSLIKEGELPSPVPTDNPNPVLAGGNIEDGIYKYAFTYWDNKGYESALSPVKTVTVSGGSGNAAVQITFTDIMPAETPGNIIGIKIYRTLKGGSTFYYVADAPDGYSMYTDTDNDLALQSAYPITGRTYAGVVNYSNAVMFSDVSNYYQFRDINFIQVFPDDGDEITGLLDEQDGVLVFKKNSICKIFTNGSPINWQRYKISNLYGCDEPNSIIRVGNSVYFAKNKRIYKYTNGSVSLVPGFQQSFNSVTAFNAVCYSTNRNWLIFAVQVNTTHYLYVYDEKLSGPDQSMWYKFTISNCFSLLEKAIGTSTGILLLGNDNSVLYYSEDMIYDADGPEVSAIPVLLQSKTFTMSDGISEARLRKLWISFLGEDYNRIIGNTTITHFLINPDNNKQKTDTVEVGVKDYERYERITDQMTGELDQTAKFYYQVTGTAINEFLALKIFYTPMKPRLYQSRPVTL